jgi:hypothetical protein
MTSGTFIRRLLLSPLLLPVAVVAGIAGLLLLGASKEVTTLAQALFVLALQMLVLIPLAFYITYICLAWNGRKRRVFKRWRRRVTRQQNARLESLDERLTEDNDPRTEKLLRDTRKLVEMLESDFGGAINGTTVALFRRLDQTLDSCSDRLEQTLTILTTADTMTDEDARAEHMRQREELIVDLQQRVAELGELTATLRHSGEAKQLNKRLYDFLNG